MGIGGIPDAVLARLHGKRDLGIHTEMFSDRVVDLVESGVDHEPLEGVHTGRMVTASSPAPAASSTSSTTTRSSSSYPSDRTNDTALIRRNPRMIAINSALRSTSPARSVPTRSATASTPASADRWTSCAGRRCRRGGKPIIALPSTAAGGKVSRIVHELSAGAGVVTTRGHVHWVVTEYGAVNLHGLTLRERGEALISIAHPDARAELRRQLAAIRHFPLG